MMSRAETFDYIDEHLTSSAFRMETLDRYGVPSDGDDVSRYLAGEAIPEASAKGPWLNELRANTAAGKVYRRVRVIYGSMTDYLCYECEWGYVYNVEAGEDIRVLDLTEVTRPGELIDQDFWLMDNTHVAVMHYGEDRALVGGTALNGEAAEPYRRAAEAAWAAAMPFPGWWQAHRQYWRASRSASTR